MKRTCVRALRLKRRGGGVWRIAKWYSTGYCSSPPSSPSSLHGLLFIHRLDRSGYYSSSGNDLYYHGVLFIQPPHRELFIQTPSTTLTVHPGKEAAVFDRLQLAAVAKESLGFS